MDMTRIKICGLKTLNDVQAVNEVLPEYVGFVFAPTKRYVTDQQALKMKKALNPKIRTVGVFVNEPIEHVIALCKEKIIDVVQLHGEENDSYIRKIKNETDVDVIKAVKVQTKNQVMEQSKTEADFLLYDTYKAGVLGGSGEQFPIEILRECIKEWNQKKQKIKPFFLAGGLKADNVEKLIKIVPCYGVDVSSGVETNGVKDKEKIRHFIEKVRKR